MSDPAIWFGIAVRWDDEPLMRPSHAGASIALTLHEATPSHAHDMDEATLCDQALRGDTASWSALVQKHNHRVVVALLGRGAPMDRAKDIAQDAWLRLVEQQREGRLSHLQLPGLAITQATFLFLESVRRVRRSEPLDDASDQVMDPRANAEATLLTEERFARAEKVLARCSPSARNVFKLVYGGEGLDHAEVATRLGLSLQRVRQIICEVRKLLRESFEGVRP
jgi:RNA polymerase sigma-70 factor (ECF subfamily)